MLSRVANTLYWMVRMVERADNLARLVDVNEQSLLDAGHHGGTTETAFWMAIIRSTGDDALFSDLYGSGEASEIIAFLTEEERNPNSISSCISQARENARMVRDQLSDELWEEINDLYHFIRSSAGKAMLKMDAPRYYAHIRRSVFTFQGVAASTIDRNMGWDFMDLGRHLERADKTTRFLDIATYLPEGSPWTMHWNSILRSCGATGAYRSLYANAVEVEKVIELLVFSGSFPRSVRYCIQRVNQCLHSISGSSEFDYADGAEKATGRLLADLHFSEVVDLMKPGLHESLDLLQTRFNLIGDGVFETYVLMPQVAKHLPMASTPIAHSRILKHQQEQQQQ
jgi:uncharacterized alpha-E superfamily protein